MLTLKFQTIPIECSQYTAVDDTIWIQLVKKKRFFFFCRMSKKVNTRKGEILI